MSTGPGRIGPLSVVLSTILLAMLLAAAPATADPGPTPRQDLRYAMYLGGLPVADLRLGHAVDGTVYDARLEIKTIGLVDAFVRYRGRVEVEGRRSPDGELQPVTFESRYERRGTTRTSRVRFDPETGAVTLVENRKRGRPQANDVPPDLWRDVIDPLTAFLALRQGLAQGSANGAQTQVFDGSRRYDLEFEVIGRERVRRAGREWAARRALLTLIPVAGFNENDVARAGGDDRMRIEVLLSDDEDLIPLEIRTLDTRVAAVFLLRAL